MSTKTTIRSRKWYAIFWGPGKTIWFAPGRGSYRQGYRIWPLTFRLVRFYDD